MKLTLSRKAYILIGVPLIFELAFVLTLVSSQAKLEADYLAESRARAFTAQLNKTLGLLVRTGSFIIMEQVAERFKVTAENTGGYSARLKQDQDAWIQQARGHVVVTQTAWQDVKKLLHENPAKDDETVKKVAELDDLIEKVVADCEKIGHMGDDGSLAQKVILVQIYHRLQKTLRLGDELLLRAQSVLETREAEKLRQSRQFQTYVVCSGVIFNILLAIALAIFFNASTLERVAILTSNSKRLARREELLPMVSGNDEIAELDRTFHEMADKLRELEARRQEFMAMVSHDLKTPLTSVGLTFNLFSAGALGTLNERGKQLIVSGESSVDRLVRMIADLLDLDKIEADMLTLEKDYYSVQDLFNEAIKSVQSMAEMQNVAIVQQNSDITVFCDADQMTRVLVNLIGNSLKFSPKGSQIILASDETQDAIEISVRDQGRGIPRNMIESIFDRFEQVESADATKRGGTGLGLAICKALVELHGGTIGVESTEGQGSKFWIRLPRKPS